LRKLGVGKGDYVFAQSFTFAASVNPILYLGAIPVFIDSEERTWNMSYEALEKAFKWAQEEGKMPKAVIVVDLYGQPAEYENIIPLCRKYNVPILEDAAEALGSTYHNHKCGTFGEIAAFSFNSNKIITTGGGGAVVSKNQEAIKKMRYWAMQARESLPYYEHKEYGYQYRMSNILAGIGCAQVPSIDEYADRRREINRLYQNGLVECPLSFMPVPKETNPNCWLTVVKLDDKNQVLPLIKELENHSIEARMAWKPMHLQPVYKEYSFFNVDEKDVSKELFEHGLCLPSASVMTNEEQDLVIDVIKKFFGRDC
jgi:pyridoxal phosphate-dependent aminotransferase EpsN